MVERNFALFFDHDEVLWVFGNLSKEFIHGCVRFLTGLDSLGREIFSGDGVATIKLVSTARGSSKSPDEVVIISLERRFFFIVSDPLVTMRMIENQFSEIPRESYDVMRGVLAGQGSVLYSNMLQRIPEKRVDILFQAALRELDIGIKPENLVGGGRCTLRDLNLRELVWFHYFLRERFEEMKEKLNVNPFAICSNLLGIPIHLDYYCPNAAILAGYLSILQIFTRNLFKAVPRAIVFGSDQLITLEVFAGKKNLLCVASWRYVIADPLEGGFLKKFFEMPQDVIQDLAVPFTKFLADKLSLRFRSTVGCYNLADLLLLLNNYRQVEETIPLAFIGIDKLRSLFPETIGDETVDKILTVKTVKDSEKDDEI